MERIPESLLNGKFFHCRPVYGKRTIKTLIIPTETLEGEFVPETFNKAIVCPERRPSSMCQLNMDFGINGGYCHYYKGDSKGVYQIVGPGMDKKSGRGYSA